MRRRNELPDYIINTYGEKIETRYNTLHSQMKTFIQKSGFSEYLVINQDMLAMAVCDYFLNIYELCQFHGINRVDREKIIAYTAYCVLSRKPIQVYEESVKHAKQLAKINERFVLLYVLDDLSDQLGGSHILLWAQANDQTKALVDMLFHVFVSDIPNAQCLQSILHSFLIYKLL